MKFGRRIFFVALAALAGCVSAQPAVAQDLSLYSFDRVTVTHGSRVPPSLGDRLRDALARRLTRRAGIPATVGAKIVEVVREGDAQLRLWAIITVTDDSSGRVV